MLSKLFARTRPSPVPQQLYGRVMAQSREPAFYEAVAVPDTVAGRFDMVCLHAFLLTRRLAREGSPLAAPLSQDFFDAFSHGLDAALRELGVGDTSIAKRMKRMLAAYYALIPELGGALDAGDAEELGRRAGARFSPASALAPAFFAAYLPAAAAELDATAFDRLARGELSMPAPAAIVARLKAGATR